jgi:roadblock/LC7 domain-containing protein
MTRHYDKGIVLIGLYVDDCYCVGHNEAIEDTIAQIKASLSVSEDMRQRMPSEGFAMCKEA